MKYLGLVFLFFIFAYLVPLAGRPMVTPDEFRYAEIPREMVEKGDYAAPRLLTVHYFEKPVLGYWMTAASFRLFGENAFALRLPAALGAGLSAFMIWLLLHQTLRDDRLAALAAALCLCSGMVYGVGTFAVLDSQVTGFITGVSVTGFMAVLEPRLTRRKLLLLILCGIFAGLAFMTKGFIAFAVPALALAGFLCWERRWKDFLTLPWIPFVVMLVVVAPWVIAAHRADPDYWRYFIVVEHWQRFTGGSGEQHPEPFWFLLPFLVAGAFPAALLAPTALAVGRKEWGRLLQRPVYRFALSAVVLPFLFFSASSGKLATYILPCFPPLAVLLAAGVAAYFRQGGHNKVFQVSLTVWGVLLTIAALGTIAFLAVNPFPEKIAGSRGMLFATAAIGLLWGALLLLCCRKVWRTRFYLFFFGLAAVLAVGGWAIPPSLIGSKAPEADLQRLPALAGFDPSRAVLVTSPSLMHAVAWVYHRPDVRTLGSHGELEYGNTRAVAGGRTPVRLTHGEYEALIRTGERPDVVYIERARKPDDGKVDGEVFSMVRVGGVHAIVYRAPGKEADK